MTWLVTVLVLALGVPLPQAEPQVVDRIVSRVGTQFVTLSDLRRCRALRLLDVADDSDEALQIAYENRILVIRDLSRPGIGAIDPPLQAVATRRLQWEARFDPGPSTADRLAAAGMTVAELETWLTDDVRIEMYLEQRFGGVPAAERAQAVDDFHRRLRRGAGLP